LLESELFGHENMKKAHSQEQSRNALAVSKSPMEAPFFWTK